MDLFQNAIKEGRLKYSYNLNPLEEGNSYSKVEEALYVEVVDLMMIDIEDNNNIGG